MDRPRWRGRGYLVRVVAACDEGVTEVEAQPFGMPFNKEVTEVWLQSEHRARVTSYENGNVVLVLEKAIPREWLAYAFVMDERLADDPGAIGLLFVRAIGPIEGAVVMFTMYADASDEVSLIVVVVGEESDYREARTDSTWAELVETVMRQLSEEPTITDHLGWARDKWGESHAAYWLEFRPYLSQEAFWQIAGGLFARFRELFLAGLSECAGVSEGGQ